MPNTTIQTLVKTRKRQISQSHKASESSRMAKCGCVWNYYVHGNTCPEHGTQTITPQEASLIDAILLLLEAIQPNQDSILAAALRHEPMPSKDGRYYDSQYTSPKGFWRQTPVDGGSWKWRPNEERCRTALRQSALAEYTCTNSAQNAAT